MKFSEFLEQAKKHLPLSDTDIVNNINSLLAEYEKIEKEYEIIYSFDESDWTTIIKSKNIELAKINFIHTHAKECIIKSITLK